MNGSYPVILLLRGKRCVVAGGGAVAERKVLGLLEAGADDVLLVSPELTERLERLAAEGAIHAERREYREGDAEGAALLFAATGDAAANARVAADGERCGALVNVADAPAAGSFLTPAVVRRGELLIAVTAGGASPSLAARIRRELERAYGPEYAEATYRLGRLRERVKKKVTDTRERRLILKRAAEDAGLMEETGNDLDRWIERLKRINDEGEDGARNGDE